MSIPNNSDKLNPIIPEITKYLSHTFDQVKVGIAQYEEGPTGCTVILFENEDGESLEFPFYADRRGGAVGAIFDEFGMANGFCLSGGSLYGLEANFGVMQYLHSKGGYSNDWMAIPSIPGAIVFDFGPRKNSIYPDKQLGKFAATNSMPYRIPIGRYGAGRMTTVGKGFDFTLGEFSGQGASFHEFGPTKILVIIILNSIGGIRARDGSLVLGHLDRKLGERVELLDRIDEKDHPVDMSNVSKNTTLTVVITNQKFGTYHLKQIAKQMHSSMSRMIDPFHTPDDGDILFFSSTNEVVNTTLPPSKFGMVGTEIIWDAVLSVTS